MIVVDIIFCFFFSFKFFECSCLHLLFLHHFFIVILFTELFFKRHWRISCYLLLTLFPSKLNSTFSIFGSICYCLKFLSFRLLVSFYNIVFLLIPLFILLFYCFIFCFKTFKYSSWEFVNIFFAFWPIIINTWFYSFYNNIIIFLH